MQIKKLILQTSALPELATFYLQLMQLPGSLSGENHLTIQIGSSELVFDKTSDADPFYHFAINIPANKVEEARAWLNERVGLIWIEQYSSDIADFVNWNAKSVYFYDATGNILELIARFDLNNEVDDPFSSSQFLSISEVGLVFGENELDKKTEALIKRYHLSYFDKQPPLPQFKALGDDEGLFIIVPDRRNWFPTTQPAQIFPIQIEFMHDGNRMELKTP